MEDRYECPNPLCGMGYATAVQKHKLAIQCPGCGAMMKYHKPTGKDTYGLGTLYEKDDEVQNAQIRKARHWKRPGEI